MMRRIMQISVARPPVVKTKMIIQQPSTPTIVTKIQLLRQREVAARYRVWAILDAFPLSADAKAWLAPRILRQTMVAQQKAAQSARAVFLGQTIGTPDTPTTTQVRNRNLVVDALIEPRIAGHVTSVVLIGVILLFGQALVKNSGLEYGSGYSRSASSAEMTLPIDAPLPQVSSDSELTVPHMVTPLPNALPPFLFYHRIRSLDTLGTIAAEYNMNPQVLFWANGLQNGRVFIVGSTLRIPRMAGVSHTILEGDTIERIAAQYSAPIEAITLFRANRITKDADLVVDREVFIPFAVPDYPEATINKYGSPEGVAGMEAIETVTVLEDETNLRGGPGRAYDKIGTLAIGQRLIPIGRYGSWIKLEYVPGELGWVKGSLLGMSDGLIEGLPTINNVPYPPPRWVWPTTGQLTSAFGWRRQPFYSFHNGIDFANKAGTGIYAARYGRVFEGGWCSGYGWCVKIDHGNGVQSVYGHMLKKPAVRPGDVVDMGDFIGLMGSSYDAAGGGYSTGVHLHFTIKVGGKAVDPMKYLP